jgi:hypothetical protein
MRLAVYRELLVTEKDVCVHSGWGSVYKRQELGIPTGILRTCREIYREAVGVLYGRNTFLYKLRDHFARVTDVDQVAQIDDDETSFPSNTMHSAGDEGDEDVESEDESSSDPEWQEEPTTTTTSARRRTRQTVQVAESDINVEKHLPLFRRVIVEAEQNRFSRKTKDLMASAINVFAHRERAGPGPWIQSLSVRVTPKWEVTGPMDDEDEDEAEGYYTFVDFFKSDSPIMKAIRGVDCRRLLICLNGYCMDEGDFRTRVFSMNMGYLRLDARVKLTGMDWWERDGAIQEQRRRRVEQALRVLDNLDKHAAKTCRLHLGQMGPDFAWGGIEELF